MQKRTPPQQHKDKRDRERRKQIKRPLPLFFSHFRSLFFVHFRVKIILQTHLFSFLFTFRALFLRRRANGRVSFHGLDSSSRGNFRANEGSCQHDLVILGCFLWVIVWEEEKRREVWGESWFRGSPTHPKKRPCRKTSPPLTRDFTLNTRLQHTHKIWVAFARKRSRRYVCNTNQT